MKQLLRVQWFAKSALKHKKLVFMSMFALLLMSAGITAFANVRVQDKSGTQLHSTSVKPKTSPASKSTPAPEQVPSAAEPPATSTSATVPAQSSPAQPTAPKPQTTKPTPVFRPTPPPQYSYSGPNFRAGRITAAYTTCSYGVLSYTVGGVDVTVVMPTTQSFSWRIELNDGTVSDAGTDSFPGDKYHWSSFPSTPDYPRMLGTIENANDGDRARLVITTPNYSAGDWSDPVPAGSEEACRNGMM